jgi:fumarate reductase subunit C
MNSWALLLHVRKQGLCHDWWVKVRFYGSFVTAALWPSCSSAALSILEDNFEGFTHFEGFQVVIIIGLLYLPSKLLS